MGQVGQVELRKTALSRYESSATGKRNTAYNPFSHRNQELLPEDYPAGSQRPWLNDTARLTGASGRGSYLGILPWQR